MAISYVDGIEARIEQTRGDASKMWEDRSVKIRQLLGCCRLYRAVRDGDTLLALDAVSKALSDVLTLSSFASLPGGVYGMQRVLLRHPTRRARRSIQPSNVRLHLLLRCALPSLVTFETMAYESHPLSDVLRILASLEDEAAEHVCALADDRDPYFSHGG